jgi:hypothetical protein
MSVPFPILVAVLMNYIPSTVYGFKKLSRVVGLWPTGMMLLGTQIIIAMFARVLPRC